jgi:hypothetical protein
MKLTPYRHVDDIAFSIRPADLLLRKGAPVMTGRNDIGLQEMDYGDSVFRFQDSGRLEEVTRQASVIQLPQAAVPVRFLGRFLREHDASVFERGGFVVSPRFGLAFAPESPSWVTALAEHCIDTWRSMR